MRLQRLLALWQQIRSWISRQLSWIDYALSFLRSPHQIVRAWPEGEIPLGPRVAIFVHFDGNGRVGAHVLHYVTSLHEAGISVVFVTNSGELQDAAFAALQPVCAGILIRRNVGYDFGAMREGLEYLKLPRADTELALIINDSVYGPLRSLTELYSEIDFESADVWGCTDSWQSRYHLQSYCMAFSPRVVASDVWRTFWTRVTPTWSKAWLVRLYEIGLTQQLLKAGFTCRAIWPYQQLVLDINVELLDDKKEDGPNLADPIVMARRRHVLRLREAVTDRTPLNPTSDLWRQLLMAKFPFVKRELLRDNPSRVPDVVEWRDVAAEVSATSLAPIDRDLQRTLKNRTP